MIVAICITIILFALAGLRSNLKRRHRELDAKAIRPPVPQLVLRKNVALAQMRVADAERDTVVAELTAHFQVGRLTQDEFGTRMDRALEAVTRGDLDALLADLPSASG